MGEAMAAGLDALVAFWKEWGVQMLVLLSLALQVILLVTAEIRRRIDSGVLRVVVWSAYLLADTTAIYTLGHMSVTSRSPEHELVAFWAPFLLLHLGGQDNITAYSIDDNRLWLRHLQSFVVQVLAAAYVLYESSIFVGGRRTILGQATILMFVVGVVKYGERVWALMSASSSALSGKNYNSFGRLHFERPDTTTTSSQTAFLAHDLLNVPKHLLKGPLPLLAFDSKIGYYRWEDMYHVAEIQLSLMHDIFYGKNELIHAWYGYCIRVALLPATVTALLLFRRVGDKDGFNKVDLVATYVLLSGAVVLEITSVLRAMSSTWRYPFFRRIEDVPCFRILIFRPLYYLLVLVLESGELLRGAIQKVGILKRYWSGSMGQHSFIYMCSHCKDDRSSKAARWMGREDWWKWNTLVYTSSSVPVSADFSQLLKKQLTPSVGVDKESPDHIQNSRGRAALKKRGLYKELAWSVDSELDESILVWHIATHVYLSWYEAKHKRLPHPTKVTQELSNYMMVLLAARPYMLPDNASRQRYIELCNKVIYHLKYSSAVDLIKLIQGHGDALNAEQTQPAVVGENLVVDMPAATTKESSVTFDRACQLASKLISKELETPDATMLDLISQVWVEMLCYTGHRCRPDSHARQLSSGGEITTVVAILMEFLKSGFLRFDEQEQFLCSGAPNNNTLNINSL